MTVKQIRAFLAVAQSLADWRLDAVSVACGMLHDVVEDCGGMPRLREIRKQFGARVAKIVEGCTDSFTDEKAPWVERKKYYLHEVKDADRETRLVSASDKLHNVRTIISDYRKDGEKIWARFNGKKAGTLWYYRALSDEYGRRGASRITRELEIAVRELERLVREGSQAGRKSRSTRSIGGARSDGALTISPVSARRLGPKKQRSSIARGR